MQSKLKLYFGQVTSSLWFRPALYALGAAAALLVTPLVEPFLPWRWKELVANDTNETVLTILASSLLAVAIFSLSAMVAALRSASNSATPRARPLLVEDAAAQNAISTFIGAFLFSLLGVIGTLLDLFNPTGRVILFVLTLILVLVVVATLIRWLQRLSSMGDVMEAVRRVEQAAMGALDKAGPPRRADAPPEDDLSGGAALFASAPGFVQAVDRESLNSACARHDLRARLCVREGDFADARQALLRTDRALSDAETETLRAAFKIGDVRLFERDPRLGLTVLSEIASKALSPGVNDPGTAIGAVRAGQRSLARWGAGREDRDAEEADQRVYEAPLSPAEAMACAFAPVAFDGAERPEVAMTLLEAYAGLAAAQPFFFAEPATAMAADLLDRLDGAMEHEPDRDRVRRRYAELGLA